MKNIIVFCFFLSVSTVFAQTKTGYNFALRNPWIIMDESCKNLFWSEISSTFPTDSFPVKETNILNGNVNQMDIETFPSADSLAGILMGKFSYQMCMGTQIKGQQLSELDVNYFSFVNKSGTKIILKVYKRIDIGDGKWYMSAVIADENTTIVQARIFEPQNLWPTTNK